MSNARKAMTWLLTLLRRASEADGYLALIERLERATRSLPAWSDVAALAGCILTGVGTWFSHLDIAYAVPTTVGGGLLVVFALIAVELARTKVEPAFKQHLQAGARVIVTYSATESQSYVAGDSVGTVDRIDSNGIAWIGFDYEVDCLRLASDGSTYHSTNAEYDEVPILVVVKNEAPTRYDARQALRPQAYGERDRAVEIKMGDLVALHYPSSASAAYVRGTYYGVVERVEDDVFHVTDYDFVRREADGRYTSTVYGVDVVVRPLLE